MRWKTRNCVWCILGFKVRWRCAKKREVKSQNKFQPMFHEIPPAILARMHELEQIDRRDRLDNTPHLRRLRQIPQCYEAVVPRMARGGILVADNAISHREELRPMLDRSLSDDRVDALIVPIGMGELVCRKK